MILAPFLAGFLFGLLFPEVIAAVNADLSQAPQPAAPATGIRGIPRQREGRDLPHEQDRSA